MIEIARVYGAMSVLIEFPTMLKDDSTYETTCPEDSLVDAVITELGNVLVLSRRGYDYVDSM